MTLYSALVERDVTSVDYRSETLSISETRCVLPVPANKVVALLGVGRQKEVK